MARAQTTSKKGRAASPAKGRRERATPRPTRQPTRQRKAGDSILDEGEEEARRRATAPTFEQEARARRAGLGFRDDDGP